MVHLIVGCYSVGIVPQHSDVILSFARTTMSSNHQQSTLKEFLALMERVVPGRVHLQYVTDSQRSQLVYNVHEDAQRIEQQVVLPFSGKIHGCIGPMFSEKSWWLISSLKKAQNAKRRTRGLKPRIDTRDEGIFSRNNGGVSVPCTLIAEENVAEVIDGLIRDRVQVVGIDELHFFPYAYALCLLLQALGFIVYVAYLDGTYKQRSFDATRDLIAIMYDCHKTRALCYECPYAPDEEAVCTIKFRTDAGTDVQTLRESTSDEDDTVPHVGGEEKYVAVCSRCRMDFYLGNRSYHTVMSEHHE